MQNSISSSSVIKCCMSGTPTALRYTIWIRDGGCIFLVGVPLNVKYQSATSQTQYLISLKGINSRSCYQLRINGNPKQDILSQRFSEISFYLNFHLYLTYSCPLDRTYVHFHVDLNVCWSRTVLNKCR